MSKTVFNQAARQKEKRRKREAEYAATIRGLPAFGVIALCLAIGAALLFFVNWAQIYNTDIPGVEVFFDGWSALAAGITRDFMSVSPIYRDLAVPFFYYGADCCIAMANLTLAAFVLLVIGIIVNTFGIFKPHRALSLAGTVANLLSGGLLIACFIQGIAMNTQADILTIYCMSNPACSIRSYAYVPAALMLAAGMFNLYAAMKYIKAIAILK